MCSELILQTRVGEVRAGVCVLMHFFALNLTCLDFQHECLLLWLSKWLEALQNVVEMQQYTVAGNNNLQNLHFNGLICHSSEKYICVRRHAKAVRIFWLWCSFCLFFSPWNDKIVCCWVWKLLKPLPGYSCMHALRQMIGALFSLRPLLYRIQLYAHMHCIAFRF